MAARTGVEFIRYFCGLTSHNMLLFKHLHNTNLHDNQDHFLQIPVKIGSLVVVQSRAVRCKIPYAPVKAV